MLKKQILLTTCFLICLCFTQAQDFIYSPTAIPQELLTKSNSVKLYSKDEFIVTDESRAIYKHREVITVLNEQAENELKFGEYSDAFTRLEDVQITLYNKTGLPSKTFKKKDLSTYGVGQNLMDDVSYYYLSISVKADEYPVTIEIAYTKKYNSLLNYPPFNIISPDQSVKAAYYTAVIPASLGLRYKNQNTGIQPVITEERGKIIYNWKAENLPAITSEPESVSWSNRFPRVWMAPNKFKMDNYSGDMSTWSNYGKWYSLLLQKANDLSTQAKTRINTMVAAAKSDDEKVRILYNYLQENFRYVSIQLGIGGFKPFSASFTDQKKYGDCKGLSNYMQACLAAVGIKSYLALINAEYNRIPVDPAFPVNNFNHVILCVPLQKDTVWLECTSPYNEYGVLGSFTENRNALLITENGGVLAQTPISKPSENKMSVHSTIDITENGGGKMKSIITCTGEYRLSYIIQLQNTSLDDQKSYFLKKFELSTPDDFNFIMPTEVKNSEKLQCSIDASFQKIIAFKTGAKFFLNIQVPMMQVYSLPKNDNRQQDYYFEFPYQKNDTTIYNLPEGFIVEHLPAAAKIDCKYGHYSFSATYDAVNNRIMSVSEMQLLKYKIPAADYKEVYQFMGKIINEQTGKIVIVKK